MERKSPNQTERDKNSPSNARQFDLFSGFGKPRGQFRVRVVDTVSGPAAMAMQQRRKPAVGGRRSHARRSDGGRGVARGGVARVGTGGGHVEVVDGRVRCGGVELRQRVVDEPQLTKDGAPSGRRVVAVQLQQLRHGLVGQIPAKRPAS